MLLFCQAPNWHFERSHRGKVQYSESSPGKENRRPVRCPPLPWLKAEELGTGLKNCWQKQPNPALLMCFWNVRYEYQCEVWSEGKLPECYRVCIYRLCQYVMHSSKKWSLLYESMCSYMPCFLTLVCISWSSINSPSQMVFHPIRPQHSPLFPWCN